MKTNKLISGALLTLAPLAMLTLAGCSQTERTTETSSSTVHDPITDTKVTEKTYSTVDGDKHVETNVQTVETDHGGILDKERDVVRIDTDKVESDTSSEVRAPLVRVKSDDERGSVHIKVPFVRIDKDGHGEKTRVRLPGIRINTDE